MHADIAGLAAALLPNHSRAGHEQAGDRAALTISPAAYNGRVGLALFCPITSRIKGYPFEVVLPPGMKVEGAILSGQVKTLDWRVREARRLCTVPPEVMSETVGRLLALIGTDL